MADDRLSSAAPFRRDLNMQKVQKVGGSHIHAAVRRLNTAVRRLKVTCCAKVARLGHHLHAAATSTYEPPRRLGVTPSRCCAAVRRRAKVGGHAKVRGQEG